MRVFLDNQSTTPTDPDVLEEMLPYFTEEFGNPHSHQHSFGQAAYEAVEQAREKIAANLGVESASIIFVSGATEANNLALRGLSAGKSGSQIISAPTEHSSVIATLADLAKHERVKVDWLPVGGDGLIDPEDLRTLFSAKTLAVSVMAVNNETGVIQDIDAIRQICLEEGVLLHTDAAQAIGKVPVALGSPNDMLASFTAHKIYGPKGIGGLVCPRTIGKQMRSFMTGGNQEGALRSGTVPVPLAVGLGAAIEKAMRNMDSDNERIRQLRDKLLDAIMESAQDAEVNGSMDLRIPNNLNIRLPGIDGDSLVNALADVAVSTGSACSSLTPEPSHVLRAMGLTYSEAQESIRISIGRFNTQDDILYAKQRLTEVLGQLR